MFSLWSSKGAELYLARAARTSSRTLPLCGKVILEHCLSKWNSCVKADWTYSFAPEIMAVVQATKLQVPQVTGLVTLGVALLLGVIAGSLNLLNTPDVLTGLFVGAAAVGTMTIATRVSGK